METPSSMRRLTRSQAATAAVKNEKKQDEVAQSRSRKCGNSDRSALLDITNDSPICGLAIGSCVQKGEKTPAASPGGMSLPILAKQTPELGESLLRDQVKTLLQKVEEETELVPFPTLPGAARSPAHLLAPTPTNTPHLPNGDDSMVNKDSAEIGHGEFQINRALLFDSPDSEGSQENSSSTEGGSSSAWSMKVNVSSKSEEIEQEDEFYYTDEGFGEEDEEGDIFNDLCEGMSKMKVAEEPKLPEFMGKHTRFIYDEEIDEIKGEEVVKDVISPNALLLKGLPVPEGKHLRFPEEDEE